MYHDMELKVYEASEHVFWYNIENYNREIYNTLYNAWWQVDKKLPISYVTPQYVSDDSDSTNEKCWTCNETGAIKYWLYKTSNLRKVDQKYLESFAMWCWRMMMISWTDRVRNEELHRVKEDRNFLHAMKRMKASRIGHI